MSGLSAMTTRRIQKELERFAEGETNMTVESVQPNLWMVRLTGVAGTLYEGESFTLRVTFDAAYPMECPEVTS
jgi:ubiquitin-protein ligase